MAGEARSNKFMLGTATVMIGNTNELYDLNPDEHSVGLVKNFTCEATKDRTDLTQGRTNDIVFTLTTSSTTRATFEMYEYSVTNIAYALGLEGGAITELTGDALVTDGAVTFASGTADLTFVDAAGVQDILVGQDVSLRTGDGENVILAKVTAVSGITGGSATSATMTVMIPDSVSVAAISAGTLVSGVTVLEVGSTDVDRDFSAKVTGQLANGTYVTYLFPKIRITSGLSMAFTTDNFGNIPFEFTPMKVTPQDDNYIPFKGLSGKLVMDTVQAPLA